MPRRDREEEPGAIQHVGGRGNNKQVLFHDDIDRQLYLTLIAYVVKRYKWKVLAYCLMSNHIHLLVQTPEPNLGEGMRELHGRFARAFHFRHGREGHHFGHRYWSRRIKTDAQLVAVVGYIVANPVEAGMVERPEDWPWGSHAAIAGGRPPRWLAVDELRVLLGVWSDPQKAYEMVIEARMAA
jgi:REP element-mobilizing transposase RayT